MIKVPILSNLTEPPKAGKSDLYRWCDYIELRCLTHIDHRFSRDSLAETIEENHDLSAEETLSIDHFDEQDDDEDTENKDPELVETPTQDLDKNERHSVNCFRQLRFRNQIFNDNWPFHLNGDATEISLRNDLNEIHYFYLSLLLSASLKYRPQQRSNTLTSLFEKASLVIFRKLMPDQSEVHAFGSKKSSRYTGHLFDRLAKLATDIRGTLLVGKHHFATKDSGDGGLDLVAWHELGDDRKGIPIAFAQCGCTADGWPNKMLEASPEKLGVCLNTVHDWSTYYFMPLDLSAEIQGNMEWHRFSDFSKAIVIDRLRFINLVKLYDISLNDIVATKEIREAINLNIS